MSKRELENPEGSGFDLRMGEVYELEGYGYLGIEERETPKSELVAKFDPKKVSSYIFEPGKYYLVKTVEKVNLPIDIAGIIFPRTTLFRSGLALFNGIVNTGYQGELTFGLCNLGKSNIKVDMGARVVHITFHEVRGEGSPIPRPVARRKSDDGRAGETSLNLDVKRIKKGIIYCF